MTQDALDAVVALLDLEAIEVNMFRGSQPAEGRHRVFGGQVAAQALVAAARTVEHGSVHSLHSYFLRTGDSTAPILYDVDRIRDGRSFTTRRVVAIQHGRAIFNMQASFHREEAGFEHAMEMPDAPDPETLPTQAELLQADPDLVPGGWKERPRPIDIRHVSEPLFQFTPGLEPRQLVWMRADGTLSDDADTHTAMLAYMSDLIMLDTAIRPHSAPWRDQLMSSTLDHLLWFHRRFRSDEWLLFATESPAAEGARGFSRGVVFSRDGQLVASVAQEGLMRPLDT